MKSSRRLDVIVAGEANVDLILGGVPPLEPDKEKLAGSMDLVLGGSSSITAYNLARLGARVGFVGVVGDDLFGGFIENKLREAGLDLSRFQRTPGARTGITVWHTMGKRRAGVTYPGTIHDLRASHVPSGYLLRARHLHVGAYFLLEKLHADAPALFRRARRLGLTTSLDCNFDPAEKWDSGIREVLAVCDVFFPNEEEVRRLTGQPDVRSAARELGKLARIVAVKRGPRGAIIFSEGRLVQIGPVPVQAVETTGAGDSFNAGFLARYVQGAPLEECGRAGAAAGALAVTRVGGTTAFEDERAMRSSMLKWQLP